jgi:hypothetical protein
MTFFFFSQRRSFGLDSGCCNSFILSGIPFSTVVVGFLKSKHEVS